MTDTMPSIPRHRSQPDALAAFRSSIRHYGVLAHEDILKLARARVAAENDFRHALFTVPEVADALLADWSERRSTRHVTGVMAEDDGTTPSQRARRVDRAFEAIELLRKAAGELRRRARVGVETQVADQLHAAGLSFRLLVETRRRLGKVCGGRARADLERADTALAARTDARGRIVRHNLGLVIAIAKRSRRDDISLLDLIQEGVLGLVRAAEKFDPERGFRFSTYAVWWIEQAVIRGIQNQARTVRLPSHVHEQQLRYRRAVTELDALGGEASAQQSLADRLGVSTQGLDQIEASLAPIRSLDAPTRDEDSASLADRLADEEAPDPGDAISRSEIRAVLRRQLRSLAPRDLEILSQRFGLDGSPPQTLDAIGQRLGLSRERVRQIEGRILRRLREAPPVQGLAEAAR